MRDTSRYGWHAILLGPHIRNLLLSRSLCNTETSLRLSVSMFVLLAQIGSSANTILLLLSSSITCLTAGCMRICDASHEREGHRAGGPAETTTYAAAAGSESRYSAAAAAAQHARRASPCAGAQLRDIPYASTQSAPVRRHDEEKGASKYC